MAYHADDTFLPSWGSGMRPREPADPNEEFHSGFDDYPPKPLKQGMLANTKTHQMNQLTTYDAEPVMDDPVMDHPVYGAITGRAAEKAAIFRRVDGVRTTQKALFLMWWPAFLGLCVTTAFGLGYWHHWWIAHEVLLVSLLIGFGMIWVGLQGGWPGRMSMTFMTVNGCCIVFMALVGALLGGICFQTYTKTYEIYRGSQVYNNVVPGINPGAHRDAGIIEFAAGSYVDAEHSIGLRNGDLYCVAPIMHADSNSYSGFWAAGTNCCTGKGNFRCADTAKTDQARSGLVVLDENYFGEPEIPEYTMAAQQASSQFNLKMPKEPIFVRWSGNPFLEKDQHLHDAFMFVIYSAGGLFTFMLVVAASLAYLGTGSGGSGFAHSYFSVQVYDDGEEEPRRVKRGRKANSNNRYPDHFNL